MELLVMGARKSRLAAVPSPSGDKARTGISSHQLRTQAEIWHRFRLFSIENRVNQTEAFEVIVLVLDKYKNEPEKIGPKIFEAFDKWHKLGKDEQLNYEDY